jgi:hypothetical protein
MELREIGRGNIEWIFLPVDKDQWRALANTVMNLRIPQNVRKFLSSRTIGGFYRTQLRIVSGTKKFQGPL